MKRILILILCGLFFFTGSQLKGELPINHQKLIDQGEFSAAQVIMRQELAMNQHLPDSTRLALAFEIERLERIKQDFCRTREEILPAIQEYFPKVTDAQIQQWETEKSLEFQIIDGQKRYFKWAANNLFRINPAAKKQKKLIDEQSGRHATDLAAFSM